MTTQLKGVSAEMSNKILNYVNSKATSETERQAMINDMLQDAINYENQQRVNSQRESMKTELRTKIAKETRTKESNQLKATLRSANLADMIRDFSQKNGWNVSWLNNDEELLNRFLQKNPNYVKDVQKYLNGQISNVDLWKRLWFINGMEAPESSLYQEENLEEPGFWAKVGQKSKDVVWGVLDSVVWVPKLIWKGLANGIWRTAKKFGADGEKVDYYVNDFKQYLENEASDIGQDKDSWTYKGTNFVADAVQVAVPTGVVNAGAKWVKLASEAGKVEKTIEKAFPKVSKLITKSEKATDNIVSLINKAGWKVDQLTTKVPTLWKILKQWVSGASDMVLFNAVNWEGTSLWEAGLWAGIGAMFPILGKAGSMLKWIFWKSASKLELTGLLNPSKLETVRSQLISEGASLPGKWTAEDVGKWMLERWFKGSKDKIVTQLEAHANKSKSMVDELLWLSQSRHKLPEVNQALEVLYNDYSKTPGLIKRADEILWLVKDEYTAQEMNQVKRYLDDAYNMYKQNWGEVAGLKAEWLREIRSKIKTTIEDVAEKEWLWNIKMLNNETQVAKGLLDWIRKKENATTIREFLSPFSTSRNGAILWGLGGSSQWDTLPEKIKNMAVGAIIWGIAGSTKAKTTFANMIKWLWGIEKKELTEFLTTKWESLLSDPSKKALYKILNNPEMQKALPYIEGGVDDAGKTIINGWKKIIADAEGNALREWAISELPTQNINYIRQSLKEAWASEESIENIIKEITAKDAKQKSLFSRIKPTQEEITTKYQNLAREKFWIEWDSVPYELTRNKEFQKLNKQYQKELADNGYSQPTYEELREKAWFKRGTTLADPVEEKVVKSPEEIIPSKKWRSNEWEDLEKAQKEFKEAVNKSREKWWKFSYDYLEELQPKFEEANKEFGSFLDVMASKTWGKSVKAPLKNAVWEWDTRTLNKAFDKENWIDDVTDIVRWTLLAEDDIVMSRAKDYIKKRAKENKLSLDDIKWDDKFTEPTELWYKDISILFPAKNWIKAELQINNPNLLVAKQWEQLVKDKIITQAEYDAIVKKAWVEGGKWHEMYNKRRKLKDNIRDGVWDLEAQKREMDKIAKESREYYAKFQK